MDLVNETISWLQNGEPVTGGSGGDSAGVLNRPLVQLLANDNGLQDRLDIIADDSGYVKKTIDSTKIAETTAGTTARVQIDAAGLKQYDGTNKTIDFDESGNVTIGYDANNKMTLAAGVLEALLNRLQIIAASNSGISLNNSVGDAINIAGAGAIGLDVEDAVQYGVKIGNCTSGGYGPLHLVNAGVVLGSLDATYNNAAVDTLAVDSNHDLCIKTGASTWQKVGATASPVAVVDTSVITDTATSSSAVVMDANGLTMRNAGGNVRFDINEDGSWTLGDSAGERIVHTSGDALSFVGGTLTSPKLNEAVALTATATELNLLDGVSGLVQADFTKLAAIDASAADLNAVTNFEETVSATTSVVSILTGKDLDIVGHDGSANGLKLNSVLVTTNASEINQLDGVVVGGSSSGDIVTIDGTQTFTNKSISASQVNSGTLDTARIPNLDASKITSGTFDAARIPVLARDTYTDGNMTFNDGTTPEEIILEANSTGANSARILFDGNRSVDMYLISHLTSYENLYLDPLQDDYINIQFGNSNTSKFFHAINFKSRDTVYSIAQNPSTPTNFASMEIAQDPYIVFNVNEDTDGAHTIYFYESGGIWMFSPIPSNHKEINLGRSDGAWDDAYADDFNNVADFYHMDDRKEGDEIIQFSDLDVIKSIQPSGEYDPVSGLRLIDDDTIPGWLRKKSKKTKEIQYDPDGKPYLSLKTMISLNMGAIREVDDKIISNFDTCLTKFDEIDNKLDQLEARIDALENL